MAYLCLRLVFAILIKKHIYFTVFDSSLNNDNFNKLLWLLNLEHNESKIGKLRKVDLT